MAGGGLMEAASKKRQGLKEGTKFQDLANLRDKAKTDAGTDNLKKFKLLWYHQEKRKGIAIKEKK